MFSASPRTCSAVSAGTGKAAAVKQAASALDIAESNVPVIAAQLDQARFNLAQCRMTAPGDGHVVNWQVQEGTMLVPMPSAAAGTFVDTSSIYPFALRHRRRCKGRRGLMPKK
jgi:multidrug resistance efflux pump